MASGFEIFGAIAGGLETLNLARLVIVALIELVNKYEKADAKLLDLQDKFETFKVRLNTWAEGWRIQDGNPNEYYIILWGESGWQIIANQLAAIDLECEDFDKTMRNLLRYGDTRRGSQRLDAPATSVAESREERLSVVRRLISTARNSVSAKDIAKLVLSKAKILDDYMVSLNGRFLTLESDAKRQFSHTNSDIPLNASERKKLETLATRMMLQRALDSRAASRALHQWCISACAAGASTIDLGLVMNLLPDYAECPVQAIPSALHYHLLIKWNDSDKEQELIIEGPVLHQAERNVAVDFLNACSTILSTGPSHFQLTVDGDPSNPFVWFRTASPPATQLNGWKFGESLLVILRDIQVKIRTKSDLEAYDLFPLPERLELAFRTVECGLMLLGTAWLSQLDNRRLLRLHKDQCNFILRLNGEFDAAFLIHNSNRIVEPQTFQIGILLLQIGTAKPFELLSIDDRRGPAFCLSGNGAESVLLPSVLDLVTKRAGLSYSRAIEFCMQQTMPQRSSAWETLHHKLAYGDIELAWRDLLNMFYESVYLPIRKLRDLHLHA
ncbi:hypothetical protein K469DRAFT_699172 [Zopfia rhizophila CBS 207.26]|uniref:Uncharacterized protein n=1 Tax=Zopfia rhizophila CBS 207.26 TaxID=1314779 RepID=A0A6A6EZM2_9PEZI|nr:hypothetical protein K469DRAFT_699172 [Zopfia rhizophila CBS 207.26]